MPKRVKRGTTDQFPERQRPKRIYFGVMFCLLIVWVSYEAVPASWKNAHQVVEKSQTYEDLVAENHRLASDANFFMTPEGMEFAVRADLGYIVEGEQTLDISEAECAPCDAKLGTRCRMGISKMMASTLDWARETKAVVCCMLGIWKPVMPDLDRAVDADAG